MRTRRKAREAALQALYQCDTLSDWTESQLELYFSNFRIEAIESEEAVIAENVLFARNLGRGVIENLAAIDALISAASTRWSITRMARVDRNILRLATCELAFHDDIPMNVSINEAIEIAKRFGTDDSPMFINGVLDNIAHNLANNPGIAATHTEDDKIAV